MSGDAFLAFERAKFRTCAVAIADGLALEPSMPELESAAKAVRTVASEYAERTRWHGRHDGEGVIEADPRMERSYERWKDADVFFVAILDRTRQVNDPKRSYSTRKSAKSGSHSFFFGDRPGRADFGMFGQLTPLLFPR